MRKVILAILAGAAAAAPAEAADHYYWHKSGVDRETFRAEAVECEEMALAARPVRTQVPYSPNPIAAGVGGLLAGYMNAKARRQMGETNMRRCMASKGYVRIAVPGKVVEEVGRLKGEARVDRMAEMAAAEPPLGPELPE
jgi:hypothetical protein